MNIIISSPENIKTTGISTDLDSAKLFISKTLNADQINISLTDGTNTYPLIKKPSIGLEKTEYRGFLLSTIVTIPPGVYTVSIEFSETNNKITLQDFVITDSQGLIDEHEPILVIGRNINAITTTILAQDVNSQQFTFYIHKKYDGISFLDDTKKIYFDFIPVDKEDLIINGKEVPFLTEPATEIISRNVLPPNGQTGEWIILKWNLPYVATKKAGIVRFAISVIDQSGDSRSYTWQTFPSSFSISANIGQRGDEVVVPEGESIFSNLVNRVTDIEKTLGNQTNDLLDDNVEIEINAGGAPIDKED